MMMDNQQDPIIRLSSLYAKLKKEGHDRKLLQYRTTKKSKDP